MSKIYWRVGGRVMEEYLLITSNEEVVGIYPTEEEE
mgnify:CR=1 FL=1|tara:strand:+ start:132 stop:239 length:108 start_codon:yes stop_codon:yes gene_type:complete